MAEEQVTAPDQHTRPNLRWIRIGGILAIIALLAMTQPFNNHDGNHGGWIADVYLVLIAGGIAVLMILDVVLRRNGLRR